MTSPADNTSIRINGKVPNFDQVTQHNGRTDNAVSFGGPLVVKDASEISDWSEWEFEGCLRRISGRVEIYENGSWEPFGLNKSVCDMELFVDSMAGDDDTGIGTFERPYKTVVRAAQQIPREIEHLITVKYDSGPHSDWPRMHSHVIRPGGQLTFECTDAPRVAGGPFVATGHTNHIGGIDLVVAGAGWTPGEWRGKFIKLASSGYIVPIYTNSADTLYLAYSYAAPATGNTFSIVDPAAVVSLSHNVVFDIDGSSDWLVSQFGVANTEFINSTSAPFLWKGDSMAIMCLCRFLTPAGENIWLQSGGSINAVGLYNAAGFDDPAYAVGYISGIQLQHVGYVPDPDFCVIFSEGKGGLNWGCGINSMCTLGGVHSGAGTHVMFGVAMNNFKLDRVPCFEASYSRIWTDAAHTTTDCIELDDHSFAKLDKIHIDNAPRDMVMVRDQAGALIKSMTGTAAATRYALHLEGSCDVTIYDQVTVTGTIDDIYFDRSAAGHVMPVSGANKNDGENSWVIMK